jgi:hypothetical protein
MAKKSKSKSKPAIDDGATEELHKQQSELLAAITSMETRLSSVISRQGKMAERLDRLEPEKVAKWFVAEESRMTELSGRMRALLLRVCVCTEVAYAAEVLAANDAGSISLGLLRLMDEPDEFWIERDDLQIGHWLKLAKDRLRATASRRHADLSASDLENTYHGVSNARR